MASVGSPYPTNVWVMTSTPCGIRRPTFRGYPRLTEGTALVGLMDRAIRMVGRFLPGVHTLALAPLVEMSRLLAKRLTPHQIRR